MQFPRDLDDAAFHSENGEFAWQRSEALAAVRVLADSGRAVLGGELWFIGDGKVWVALPQQSGPAAVFCWATERRPGESWPIYVARSRGEALSAIQALPGEAGVTVPPTAKVYYNLTWATADE